ncbi:MAG: polymerase [Gammaproteobacteria bacterium]|jgi:DNA polymerase-4|nr:polymerase [Gammaproteobacteria bacterium]
MRRSDARAILHIDMDAFYASVEEQDRPELKGTPLIVGGTGGRGVVAAASYAVRRFGVHSAMPMREALRLCPDAIVVHPRMARYQEVSDQVFAIFHEFTPVVEGLSLDEAFLDVTASRQLKGDPEVIGAEIRRRIAKQTGLTASVGIAPNKLLAKIASDLNKPDGMCRIDAANLREILDPLPIHKLFGVGQKTLPTVLAAGIRTFGDARLAGNEMLWRAFGKHGNAMRDRASGLDDRPVQADREEKSISAEETFDVDIRAAGELKSQLRHLADRTTSRLRAHKLLAGTVSVKIRRADFTTYTRQRTLEPATQDTDTVSAAAEALLTAWLASQPQAAVRLLGVGVSDLQLLRQSDLFEGSLPDQGSRLDSAVDGIRDRFGAGLLTRASRLPRGTPHGN